MTNEFTTKAVLQPSTPPRRREGSPMIPEGSRKLVITVVLIVAVVVLVALDKLSAEAMTALVGIATAFGIGNAGEHIGRGMGARSQPAAEPEGFDTTREALERVRARAGRRRTTTTTTRTEGARIDGRTTSDMLRDSRREEE